MSNEHKCIVCGKTHHEEYDQYFCSLECQDVWNKKYHFDTTHTHLSSEGAVCPFCGNMHDASQFAELWDESLQEFTCDRCGKKFKVETHQKWSWETKPLDDDYSVVKDKEVQP